MWPRELSKFCPPGTVTVQDGVLVGYSHEEIDAVIASGALNTVGGWAEFDEAAGRWVPARVCYWDTSRHRARYIAALPNEKLALLSELVMTDPAIDLETAHRTIQAVLA